MQLKKRGRPEGSKKKVCPEIRRMLGDASLHYALGRYEEVNFFFLFSYFLRELLPRVHVLTPLGFGCRPYLYCMKSLC